MDELTSIVMIFVLGIMWNGILEDFGMYGNKTVVFWYPLDNFC